MALLVPVIKSNYSLYTTTPKKGYPTSSTLINAKQLAYSGGLIGAASHVKRLIPKSEILAPINKSVVLQSRFSKHNQYVKMPYSTATTSNGNILHSSASANSSDMSIDSPIVVKQKHPSHNYYSSEKGGKRPTTIVLNGYTLVGNSSSRHRRLVLKHTAKTTVDGKTAFQLVTVPGTTATLSASVQDSINLTVPYIAGSSVVGNRRFRSVSERSKIITPMPIIFENERLGSGPEMLFHPHTAPPLRKTRLSKRSLPSSSQDTIDTISPHHTDKNANSSTTNLTQTKFGSATKGKKNKRHKKSTSARFKTDAVSCDESSSEDVKNRKEYWNSFALTSKKWCTLLNNFVTAHNMYANNNNNSPSNQTTADNNLNDNSPQQVSAFIPYPSNNNVLKTPCLFDDQNRQCDLCGCPCHKMTSTSLDCSETSRLVLSTKSDLSPITQKSPKNLHSPNTSTEQPIKGESVSNSQNSSTSLTCLLKSFSERFSIHYAKAKNNGILASNYSIIAQHKSMRMKKCKNTTTSSKDKSLLINDKTLSNSDPILLLHPKDDCETENCLENNSRLSQDSKQDDSNFDLNENSTNITNNYENVDNKNNAQNLKRNVPNNKNTFLLLKQRFRTTSS